MERRVDDERECVQGERAEREEREEAVHVGHSRRAHSRAERPRRYERREGAWVTGRFGLGFDAVTEVLRRAQEDRRHVNQ